jgi:TonB family protein
MAIVLVLFGLLAAAPAPAAPAAGDEEVWALASKVGTLLAYETYLIRFPRGVHALAGWKSFERLSRPGTYVAPPLPPPPLRSPTPPSPSKVAACVALLADDGKPAGSEEARAFLAARRSNRPADYRAYLEHYPKGACAAVAAWTVYVRAERVSRFVPIPGLGPLAAHRITTLRPADYPPWALRQGEQGRVVAEWEIAEDGGVESCHLVESSRSAALDDATCRRAMERLRYDPARDASGAVIRVADRMIVDWTLAPEPPPARPREPRR